MPKQYPLRPTSGKALLGMYIGIIASTSTSCITPILVESDAIHLGAFVRLNHEESQYAESTEHAGIGLTLGRRKLGAGLLKTKSHKFSLEGASYRARTARFELLVGSEAEKFAIPRAAGQAELETGN